MEKTLVVVIAETRGYEHSFASFRANVLESLDADLALCVAGNPWEHIDNPFYQHAKHIWTYEEPEDWGSAFDIAQTTEGARGDWRSLLSLDGIWMGGVHDQHGRTKGSGSILLFFRWFLKNCLKDSGVCDMYDRFIITRSDFIYLTPHYPVQRMDPGLIWIPEGEDYGGYTDRHIVVSRDDVDSVLSIADPILRNPGELFAKMKCRKEWNLERYVRFAFRELNLDHRVRRYPYTMYAVRSMDGRSSWSTGAFSKRHGYCIKYRDEHRKSLVASKLITKPEDWTPAATIAFFQVVELTSRLQHFINIRVHTITNSRLRKALCKIVYSTVLSDRAFGSVYARMCLVQASLLNLLTKSRCEASMRSRGFIEPVHVASS